MSSFFEDCFAQFGVANASHLGSDRPYDEWPRRGAARLESRASADPDFYYRLRRGAAARSDWSDLSLVSDSELYRRVLNEIDGGRLALRPRCLQRYGTPGEIADGGDPTESGLEDLAEKHFIGFMVLDGNGNSYPGLPYTLRSGPDDDPEQGTFDDAGEFRKDNVYDANYALTLREVRDVQWQEERAGAGVPATLRASVPGFDDGDMVEVRLFKELLESDDDVLESLEVEVRGGVIELQWCYEHDRNGPFKSTTGVVPIVAEVRDRAEGPWAKSPAPLQLQLPTVDEPLWSADQVGPGDPVEISVRAPGAPDGTPMQIEVFSRRRDGQEQSLEIFDEVVQDEHVAVQWAYTEDTKGQAETECFFIATLDGDPVRVAVSANLWVSSRPQNATT